MAIGIHVARIDFRGVNPSTGQLIDKNNSTIADNLVSEHRHIIMPDGANSNTDGYPSIETYLEREAADDYILGHISQNLVVTYDAGGINAAS